jgi:hypothetical protein
MYFIFQGGDFMKKIILAVIATSMLLTNVAFASTKTTHTNTGKNNTVSSVKQNNVYHVNSTDPY